MNRKMNNLLFFRIDWEGQRQADAVFACPENPGGRVFFGIRILRFLPGCVTIGLFRYVREIPKGDVYDPESDF